VESEKIIKKNMECNSQQINVKGRYMYLKYAMHIVEVVRQPALCINEAVAESRFFSKTANISYTCIRSAP
jgi:hypothetical protein